MREPVGDVQCAPVLGRELDAEPLRVRRRFGAQVDDHVPDLASSDADELCLAVWRGLPMHPAQRPAPHVERNVALRHTRIEVMFLEFAPAETAREESPLVLAPLEVDDHGAGQLRRSEDHGMTVSSGIGTTH